MCCMSTVLVMSQPTIRGTSSLQLSNCHPSGIATLTMQLRQQEAIAPQEATEPGIVITVIFDGMVSRC